MLYLSFAFLLVQFILPIGSDRTVVLFSDQSVLLPAYPSFAIANRIQGRVDLLLHCSQGKVLTVETLSSDLSSPKGSVQLADSLRRRIIRTIKKWSVPRYDDFTSRLIVELRLDPSVSSLTYGVRFGPEGVPAQIDIVQFPIDLPELRARTPQPDDQTASRPLRPDIPTEIRDALNLFRFDVGRYPTQEEGLEALVSDPGATGWAGPYLSEEAQSKLGEYQFRIEKDRPIVFRK